MKKLLTQIFHRFRKKEFIRDVLYGEKELTFEDKKAIAWLISTEEFRKFEKYLKVKQRTRVSRMLHCPEDEVLYLRRDVSLLAEITADLSRFWVETQNPQESKSAKEKKIKLFGKNRIKL